MNVTPERAMELSQRITETWQAALSSGVGKSVMLTDFRVRPHLAAMLSRQLPQLPVLAYDEIAMGTEIQSVGTVSLEIHAEAGAEPVMAAT